MSTWSVVQRNSGQWPTTNSHLTITLPSNSTVGNLLVAVAIGWGGASNSFAFTPTPPATGWLHIGGYPSAEVDVFWTRVQTNSSLYAIGLTNYSWLSLDLTEFGASFPNGDDNDNGVAGTSTSPSVSALTRSTDLAMGAIAWWGDPGTVTIPGGWTQVWNVTFSNNQLIGGVFVRALDQTGGPLVLSGTMAQAPSNGWAAGLATFASPPVSGGSSQMITDGLAPSPVRRHGGFGEGRIVLPSRRLFLPKDFNT